MLKQHGLAELWGAEGRRSMSDHGALVSGSSCRPYADAIKALMSSTRHIVQRPSFTGLGKRPVLTPSHQQVFLTGMIGGIGGLALGSPMICGKRRKPVSGREYIFIRPSSGEDGDILSFPEFFVAACGISKTARGFADLFLASLQRFGNFCQNSPNRVVRDGHAELFSQFGDLGSSTSPFVLDV